VVKLVFPRGDAANLLFDFDPNGKITGFSLMSWRETELIDD
jgi:hypothetical protein